ncbi:uncharacterized protein C1orf131 homolog [Aphidius gifuensis]|uniref:uncharacterized protein C1orf131 homolog n=1 Tax=Aphidius gifuensis TaxID=684658 RepID=UPI001CDB6D33|nr:uncharacterized protein C1orf131 homolog [Aphidius gifuensis]
MEDFVMTKGARDKQNIVENFVSVTHSSYKKKPKQQNDDINKFKLNKNDNDDIDPRRKQEIEMKRLRWDIMKFGSSGFDKTTKNKAKVELAISLGAIPPKNRAQNYKRLQQNRKLEKTKEKETPERQSGVRRSLKSTKTKKKRVKKDTGILGVYGKVEKKLIK